MGERAVGRVINRMGFEDSRWTDERPQTDVGRAGQVKGGEWGSQLDSTSAAAVAVTLTA